ncbi:HlyD family secretion protein [Selenomonas sp. F0473]|uniref:HlyD family secretion protein n=1 Tax=Selenomonas sp. F0473 TaxID=999423 RepID=UPI00029E7B33|nr:HlyD family secretion protein [Selenomonas sp. F0473]EKU71395.1 hypothetical protein HMPREF9161_00080 [Selenomonas sp. F0473]
MRATEANSARDYERMAALFAEGAVSKEALDNAEMRLSVARAATRREEEGLAQLLGGAADTGSTDTIALPTIDQARQRAANMANDVAALEAQRDALLVQKRELEVARDRLVLRAPEDGKILKILAKKGEMIAPSAPVVLLESKRGYYDIYVSERQVGGVKEGSRITGHTVAGARTDAKLPSTNTKSVYHRTYGCGGAHRPGDGAARHGGPRICRSQDDA